MIGLAPDSVIGFAGMRKQDMGTGESLSAPERVQRLRTALHAKAKGSPGFRFYSLCDKVWRADVLAAAWQAVRRNGGAGGVDGETVADIETYGVSRWLGELAWYLKARNLPVECSTAGSHSEETTRGVPTVGHSLHMGLNDADGGDAGPVGDKRSGPATGAVRLPTGKKCA